MDDATKAAAAAAKKAEKARRKAEFEKNQGGKFKKKEKPKLSKAERRAKQEKQREEKEARNAKKAAASGSGPASSVAIPALTRRGGGSVRSRAESVGARMFSHLPAFSKRTSLELETGTGESPSDASSSIGRRPSTCGVGRASISGGGGDSGSDDAVHAAVLRLGLKIAEGGVDDDARCEAMLGAFRKVIDECATAEELQATMKFKRATSYSKALDKLLGRQISFLCRCLPSGSLSVTMGNAVRYLRGVILKVPVEQPELTDAEARAHILQSIDDWVESKITFAHDRVAELAARKIVDGDVVLLFVGSPAIEQALLRAQAGGVDFRVVVVDARPHLGAKPVLKRLAEGGIRCTYVLITALSFVMKEVTKVLLGATACMSNGAVVGRAGTTMVACLAAAHHIPVLLCCETYKFCDQVGVVRCVEGRGAGCTTRTHTPHTARSLIAIAASSPLHCIPPPPPPPPSLSLSLALRVQVRLESITTNELLDPDALVPHHVLHGSSTSSYTSSSSSSSTSTSTSGSTGAGTTEEDEMPLVGWREVPNLELLNFAYDLTPSQYITVVVTEVGMVPPTSVPVIIREVLERS